MVETGHLVPNPSFLLTPNANMNIPLNQATLICPTRRIIPPLRLQIPIICAAKRRNRRGIVKSSKIALQTAFIVASKLRLLPEPVELILKEFGVGNGGGNGFWNGFGWNGFDGWRRRRKSKLGMIGVLAICGAVGLWFVLGKELVLDGDAFLGGLGLLLFGLTVEGWRRGARDWILGFCCCAFLVGLVTKKDDVRAMVTSFGRVMKNRRRKRRAF